MALLFAGQGGGRHNGSELDRHGNRHHNPLSGGKGVAVGNFVGRWSARWPETEYC